MQLSNLSAETANTVLRPCTDQFKMSMGLPCAHIIQECLKEGESLDPDHFNTQWHLEQEECLPIDYCHLVQDPEKVQSRERPRESSSLHQQLLDRSTQRIPSTFERVDEQIAASNQGSRQQSNQGRRSNRGTRQRSNRGANVGAVQVAGGAYINFQI